MLYAVIHYLQYVHLIANKTNMDNTGSEDCVKKFSKDLRRHEIEIIDYKKTN